MKKVIIGLLTVVSVVATSSCSFTSTNANVFDVGTFPTPTEFIDFEEVIILQPYEDTFKIEITGAKNDYDVKVYQRETIYVDGLGEQVFAETINSGESFDKDFEIESNHAYIILIYESGNDNRGEWYLAYNPSLV